MLTDSDNYLSLVMVLPVKGIMDLPFEVILKIFGSLSEQDVVSVELVCRAFHDLVKNEESLWKRLASHFSYKPVLRSLTLHDNMQHVRQPTKFWKSILKLRHTLDQTKILSNLLTPVEASLHVKQSVLIQASNVDMGVICGITYAITLQQNEDTRCLLFATLDWSHVIELKGKANAIRFNHVFLSEFPVVDNCLDVITLLIASFEYKSELLQLDLIQFTSKGVMQSNTITVQTPTKNVSNRPDMVTHNNNVALKLSYDGCSTIYTFFIHNTQLIQGPRLTLQYFVHSISLLGNGHTMTLVGVDGRSNFLVFKLKQDQTEELTWIEVEKVPIHHPVSDFFATSSRVFNSEYFVFFNSISSELSLLDIHESGLVCSPVKSKELSDIDINEVKCSVFDFTPFSKSLLPFMHHTYDNVEECQVGMIGSKPDNCDVVTAAFRNSLRLKYEELRHFYESKFFPAFEFSRFRWNVSATTDASIYSDEQEDYDSHFYLAMIGYAPFRDVDRLKEISVNSIDLDITSECI